MNVGKNKVAVAAARVWGGTTALQPQLNYLSEMQGFPLMIVGGIWPVHPDQGLIKRENPMVQAQFDEKS